MPEGPEVQAIVDQLNKFLVNKRILDFSVVEGAENVTKPIETEDFASRVTSKKVVNVSRRGKYIDITLTTGLHIVFHLLINGRLLYCPSGDSEVEPRYTRCYLVFDDNSILYFSDFSKWIRLSLVEEDEIQEFKSIKYLGIDIYSREFTLENFREILRTRKRIHSLLLDQKKVAGLGNIYATEALFLSGIHPLKPANSLSSAEAFSLFFAIKNIVVEALRENGTTLVDMIEKRPYLEGYYTPDGEYGNFQRHIHVFQRRGHPCPRCGTKIEYIKVSGRGATYCPKDQPLQSEIDESDLPEEFAIGSDDRARQLPLDLSSSARGNAMANKIYIIFGLPSVGKSTLAKGLLQRIPFLTFLPTVKTRRPRKDETDYRESEFVSDEEFRRLVEHKKLTIYTRIYDISYGIREKDFVSALSSSRDALVIAWANGAKALKEKFPADVRVIAMVNQATDELRHRILERPDYTQSKRRNCLHAIQHEPVPTEFCDLVIKRSTRDQALYLAADYIYATRVKA